MKPLEGELRVAGELSAISSRRLEIRQPTRDVLLFVPGRALLNESDFHDAV
jgi:hypothetical protein